MTSYPPAPPPPPPGGPGSQPPGGPAPQPPAYPLPPAPAHTAPAEQISVPPVAWLVPLAGLLALIGGVTKWFRPELKASFQGKSVSGSAQDSVFSWDDGKIGLLGPILLIVIGIGVAGLLLGRAPKRFDRGSHPVTTAAKGALIAGGVALVCTVISWFLVKSQYKFSENGRNYSWDDYIKLAKASGITLNISRSPQIGFFLTIAAALVAIVGGALMLATHKNSPSASGPTVSQVGYQPPPPPASQPPSLDK